MAVYKGNKANQKDFKWTEYTRIHLSESLSTAVTSNHRNMQCHVTKSATPLKTCVLGVYTHRKVERFYSRFVDSFCCISVNATLAA